MAARFVDRTFKHLLQWLIAGQRGGVNRALIINELRNDPKNANQLSNLLKLDYRTIRHHLQVLEKNRLITSIGEQYGKMYFLSSELEDDFEVFEEIWTKIGKKLKRKNSK
jgi:DNA-binding transcriptional ArsR family regulator